MAAVSCLLSEDQFLCPICLDVFSDPVSTPCGHNFCKTCITEHWNTCSRCLCPMCKEAFTSRPDLKVNTLFSGMVAQFRQRARSSEKPALKPGEVPCDVCAGTRLKALKSCLVCLASYCESHLEPHLKVSGLKRHQLIEPVENLEDRMCRKHDKPLELFCRTDQTCVCTHCSALEHKMHEFVPLKEECEEKKAKLQKTEAEIQQMIEDRRAKIQEVKQSVHLSKEDANRETAEGVRVFNALMESVKKGRDSLVKSIGAKQKTVERWAEAFVKDLEQEICELTKRSAEVERLSHSEDSLHLLQSVQSLNTYRPPSSWTTEVRICPSYKGTVAKAVAQLKETLTKKATELLAGAELRRVQRHAVDVTLDPDTAHPQLTLSADGKQVYDSDVKKKLPDNPQRFSYYMCVLGKQGISSGRFYFEVQVKGKTKWTLGVAKESISRKGKISYSPGGGKWTIWLRDGNQHYAPADPPVPLAVKSQPQKVGVFVDYEEGLVSFYDADTAALIYSFTGCCFTEKLFPYFNPCQNYDGKNSAPLIICPVKQTG